MSQVARCSFCRKLPPLRRNRSGKATKCPVCKAELRVNNGATYRPADPGEGGDIGADRTGSWNRLAAIGVACAMLVLGVGIIWSQRNDSTRSQRRQALSANTAAASIVAKSAQASPHGRKTAAILPADEVAFRKAPADMSRFQKATSKPVPQPQAIGLPNARAKGASRTVLVAERNRAPIKGAVPGHISEFPESLLHAMLQAVPQVDLEQPRANVDPRNGENAQASTPSAKEEIARKIREIKDLTRDHPDAFIRRLQAQRPHLAGLPFLLGNSCRLDEKAAQTLALASRTIRSGLDRADRSRQHYPQLDDASKASQFWSALPSDRSLSSDRLMVLLGGLKQLLLVEPAPFRRHLVDRLQDSTSPETTQFLSRLALFDLDHEVRLTALGALKSRPPADIAPLFLEGLRYPWPSVAYNAAAAIEALHLTEMIPRLVDLLDEPSPSEPFAEGPNKEWKVREVVRINHHRNCLLCHAPAGANTASSSLRSVPLGPIPVPGERFPESRSIYYGRNLGDNVVRADVTYLRQDFSLMMPVADSGAWPKMQRYDFLVRTRAVKHNEKQLSQRDGGCYQDAIVCALRSLTGKDAASTARAWRAVLGLP